MSRNDAKAIVGQLDLNPIIVGGGIAGILNAIFLAESYQQQADFFQDQANLAITDDKVAQDFLARADFYRNREINLFERHLSCINFDGSYLQKDVTCASASNPLRAGEGFHYFLLLTAVAYFVGTANFKNFITKADYGDVAIGADAADSKRRGHYLQHKHSPVDMAHTYQYLKQAVEQAQARFPDIYGNMPKDFYRRIDLDQLDKDVVALKSVTACYDTREELLDPQKLFAGLKNHVQRLPNIKIHEHHEVTNVTHTANGGYEVTVKAEDESQEKKLISQELLLCAWFHNGKFSEQLQMSPESGTNRLKGIVRVRVPKDSPMGRDQRCWFTNTGPFSMVSCQGEDPDNPNYVIYMCTYAPVTNIDGGTSEARHFPKEIEGYITGEFQHVVMPVPVRKYLDYVTKDTINWENLKNWEQAPQFQKFREFIDGLYWQELNKLHQLDSHDELNFDPFLDRECFLRYLSLDGEVFKAMSDKFQQLYPGSAGDMTLPKLTDFMAYRDVAAGLPVELTNLIADLMKKFPSLRDFKEALNLGQNATELDSMALISQRRQKIIDTYHGGSIVRGVRLMHPGFKPCADAEVQVRYQVVRTPGKVDLQDPTAPFARRDTHGLTNLDTRGGKRVDLMKLFYGASVAEKNGGYYQNYDALEYMQAKVITERAKDPVFPEDPTIINLLKYRMRSSIFSPADLLPRQKKAAIDLSEKIIQPDEFIVEYFQLRSAFPKQDDISAAQFINHLNFLNMQFQGMVILKEWLADIDKQVRIHMSRKEPGLAKHHQLRQLCEFLIGLFGALEDPIVIDIVNFCELKALVTGAKDTLELSLAGTPSNFFESDFSEVGYLGDVFDYVDQYCDIPQVLDKLRAYATQLNAVDHLDRYAKALPQLIEQFFSDNPGASEMPLGMAHLIDHLQNWRNVEPIAHDDVDLEQAYKDYIEAMETTHKQHIGLMKDLRGELDEPCSAKQAVKDSWGDSSSGAQLPPSPPLKSRRSSMPARLKGDRKESPFPLSVASNGSSMFVTSLHLANSLGSHIPRSPSLGQLPALQEDEQLHHTLKTGYVH